MVENVGPNRWQVSARTWDFYRNTKRVYSGRVLSPEFIEEMRADKAAREKKEKEDVEGTEE